MPKNIGKKVLLVEFSNNQLEKEERRIDKLLQQYKIPYDILKNTSDIVKYNPQDISCVVFGLECDDHGEERYLIFLKDNQTTNS